MSTCSKCNHDHEKLGVRIEKRTLYRSAVSGHRVKNFGGAWGFAASFWDPHRSEFDFVQVDERDTLHVYRTSAAMFDQRGVRATLHPLFGLQVILPLVRFNKPETPEDPPEDPPAAAPVQLILGLGQTQRTVYEKAKRPRPRRAPKRRQAFH